MEEVEALLLVMELVLALGFLAEVEDGGDKVVDVLILWDFADGERCEWAPWCGTRFFVI